MAYGKKTVTLKLLCAGNQIPTHLARRVRAEPGGETEFRRQLRPQTENQESRNESGSQQAQEGSGESGTQESRNESGSQEAQEGSREAGKQQSRKESRSQEARNAAENQESSKGFLGIDGFLISQFIGTVADAFVCIIFS
ncbi:MAG TPA: hypothetical protein VM940_03845 [Chthoniobacterales bacterium]|jgi:hypothetical protein|nr:hypothetical protein [Chthoniobacterales bacterium]